MIIVLSGEGPRVTCDLHPPIRMGNNDVISLALAKIMFYNSFANIHKGKNNCVKIKPGDGKESIMVQIPTGAYEINQINLEIIHQLKAAGGDAKADEHFKLQPNTATLKSMITITKGYIVDFNVNASIAPLLGYLSTDKLIGGDNKRYEGKNIVKITQISSLLVMCDAVRPSFLNGKLTSFVHNCVLDVEPGVKFIDKPSNLTFVNTSNNVITQLSCWGVDQNLNTVDFRHEQLEIELKLKITRGYDYDYPSSSVVDERRRKRRRKEEEQ